MMVSHFLYQHRFPFSSCDRPRPRRSSIQPRLLRPFRCTIPSFMTYVFKSVQQYTPDYGLMKLFLVLLLNFLFENDERSSFAMAVILFRSFVDLLSFAIKLFR